MASVCFNTVIHEGTDLYDSVMSERHPLIFPVFFPAASCVLPPAMMGTL